MDGYKTLSMDGKSMELINKSRFIAIAAHIENELQALTKIAEQKSLHPDATHHCYGYAIGAKGDCTRYSDDGEPTGTAGMPILSVLRKQELTDCIIVVTRYFGGIQLGAGGLVRAYSGSAAGAITNAKIALMLLSVNIEIRVSYPLYARLEHFFKSCGYAKIKSTTFENTVNAYCITPVAENEKLTKVITALTDGKAAVEMKEKEYYPWEIRE